MVSEARQCVNGGTAQSKSLEACCEAKATLTMSYLSLSFDWGGKRSASDRMDSYRKDGAKILQPPKSLPFKAEFEQGHLSNYCNGCAKSNSLLTTLEIDAERKFRM